jgi:hypothetical protein
MSQVPGAKLSDLDAEKDATSPLVTGATSTSIRDGNTPSRKTPLKLRSCAVCRSRRVRCDKQSPCSNCRRAGITCVYPSPNRPPRWARCFEASTGKAAASSDSAPRDTDPNIGDVTDRLRDLESLIKDLRCQLETAQAANRHSPSSPALNVAAHSPQHIDGDSNQQENKPLTTPAVSVDKQFGRLVIQDDSRSRYVSSGFWSEVNDKVSWPCLTSLLSSQAMLSAPA